jgi:hypothetical protein
MPSILSAGLVLLVRGETNFDAAGFTLVMVAACLSGLRFTLTQIFLHGLHDGGEQRNAVPYYGGTESSSNSNQQYRKQRHKHVCRMFVCFILLMEASSLSLLFPQACVPAFPLPHLPSRLRPPLPPP